MKPAQTEKPKRQTVGVREAAERLGVSPGHLYLQIRANQFPHLKIGQRVLIPIAAIDRLLDEVA
jgi:excisionase family DNA binding protein